MKAKKLTIHNIGLLRDVVIEIDKPLIIFFGNLRMGKTTILNSVRYLFGGSYPSDIITHGQEEAFVELEFDNATSIRREWYIGRDGTVKDREIVFIRDGKPVKKPVQEISKLLNPFLLDQEYLFKMNETERKKYFTQLFAVDTSEIDSTTLKYESTARDLRAKIKGYGHIDLTEVKPIDVTALKAELKKVRDEHESQMKQILLNNEDVARYNNQVDQAVAELKTTKAEIAELKARLAKLETNRELLEKWLIENPMLMKKELPMPPDTSELETKISEAAANEVRVEQYQKSLKRAKEKKADEAELSDIEKRQRELKKEKVAKLSEISENCGIKELKFDETGDFVYQGTSSGMLSTSQLMTLSEDLSALYPEGLGITLIDRAESLNWASKNGLTSVNIFIKKAQDEEKTILATVVGEADSEFPEQVGVFIVNEGQVSEVRHDLTK